MNTANMAQGFVIKGSLCYQMLFVNVNFQRKWVCKNFVSLPSCINVPKLLKTDDPVSEKANNTVLFNT